MTEMDKLMVAGRHIDRAFVLLDRANEYTFPSDAAVITTRGLLDEARRAVDAARRTMAS